MTKGKTHPLVNIRPRTVPGSFSVLKDPAPLARLEAVYGIVCSSVSIIANICSRVKSFFKKYLQIFRAAIRGVWGHPKVLWNGLGTIPRCLLRKCRRPCSFILLKPGCLNKQRPCTYKSGDSTVQRQLVRDKVPMTLGFFDENYRYHRDRDTFCNQFEYPVDYRNFFINNEWLFTTLRVLVNMLNMATLKKHSVGMIHNDQKNSLCK